MHEHSQHMLVFSNKYSYGYTLQWPGSEKCGNHVARRHKSGLPCAIVLWALIS